MSRPATVHPVELAQAYRLINTGASVFITSAHGAQRDVMACAWNMALDFSPAKLAVQDAHDLFIAEAVAAWADERAFAHGKYLPLGDTPPAWRTLHHLGAGNFLVPGEQLKAKTLASLVPQPG